jgi:MEMO1 family protein
MLVFSAIMPHPPILIPTIGKENLDKLKKTNEALAMLEKDFRASKPELVILISPHGDIYPDAFTINTLPTYELNFNDFGDFETKKIYKGDLAFINRFKEQVESSLSVNLKSNPKLDHGIGVPLYFLSQNYKKFTLVPINYSFLSFEKHLEFGEQLKEAIVNSDKRIALIASGDLSHRLSKDAPGGFSPNAKNFDKELIQILKSQKIDNLLNMNKELIEDAGECGLRSFLILLGALKDMRYEFQVLSYEGPFGVGYLVANIKLN